MNGEKNVNDIFRDLKEFAKKHKAQFLCMFYFPEKHDGKFLSDGEGNARTLINEFLKLDKNSILYIKK
jgi:GTP-dependent phosphoenolpyruvate carboxykinase